MFRARNPQRSLFSAKNQYRHLLKDGSFHALLSQFGEELFDDHSFEHLYCEDNGRPCIPPSQMFMLLLLQMHDGSSDEEAAGRTGWDLRWSAVLDLEPGVTLCGKTTLQEFRARVLLNETAEEQFKKSLGLARKLGIIKGPLQIALDTTPILGRGAVKDTYNLIGDGIRKVGQVLAKMEGVSAEHWAGLHDLSRYWEASSLKGEAGIDWSDDTQRRVFLNSLVADADRILLLAAQLSKSANEEWAGKITEASALLRRLIRQTAEHTLARCVQLGARQARYMGRRKTKFQMLMIAMVANLTKMAGAIYSRKNASLESLQLLSLGSPCPPCPPCLKSYLRTLSRQKRALEPLVFKNGGFRLAS